MFKSAAEEISQWADQCRSWGRQARTRDQKLMLQSLERILTQAALDAEDALDVAYGLHPLASSRS